MTSQRTRGGKLVELERAIIDFHQYLAQQMLRDDEGPKDQREKS